MKLSMTTLEALNLVNKGIQLQAAYDLVIKTLGPIPAPEYTVVSTETIKEEEITFTTQEIETPPEGVKVVEESSEDKEKAKTAKMLDFILSSENSLDYGILDITKANDEISFAFKSGFFNEFVDAYCAGLTPLLTPIHSLMIESRKVDKVLDKIIKSYITKK